MEKFLIVDGMNLLFQMYFGMPSRIVNHDNLPIQGIIGFVGALLKIIQKVNPKYCFVIFDGEEENPRKLIDENYKANRDIDEEDNPFEQLPYVYKALEYLKIKTYECSLQEADDLIAAYALTYRNDYHVTIASFDSDFFQLIHKNVDIFRYRGEKSYLCNLEWLWNKYEIKPTQYSLFKSLTGDTADNILGVKGIGPKTASKIVNKYESLKDILDASKENDMPAPLNRFVFNEEHLTKNYDLINLKNLESLPFKMKELTLNLTTNKTMEVLYGIGVKKQKEMAI